MHLFWANQLTSTSAPRLLYSAYRNGVWTPEEVAFDYPPYGTNSNPQTWASAQVGNDGQVYAIAQYVHYNLYTYQAKRTTAGWPAKVVPDTGLMDAYQWILGDRDGAVRRFITRYEYGTYHGYYSYWRDGTYLIQDALMPFDTRNTSGQLDAGNNLHVYWRAEVPVPGGQVMGLYHQCFDPAMTPAGGPELLTGQDATAASLLPAADEAGRWSLAWQMVATGEAKLGVWQGCQRQKILSVPPDPATPWPPFQALFSRTPNRWCGVWRTGSGVYQVRCGEMLW